MTIAISSSRVTTYSREYDEVPLVKAGEASKQSMQLINIGAAIEAQVQKKSPRLPIAIMLSSSSIEPANTRPFSDGEALVVVQAFASEVCAREAKEFGKSQEETLSALVEFDPGLWEKHLSVFLQAIIAINVARQSSASMNGMFVQMAYASAKAQGASIIAGGVAAMSAAVSGSVIGISMAVGGGAMSVRGSVIKHRDIKYNKIPMRDHEATMAGQMASLNKLPSSSAPPRPVNLDKLTAGKIDQTVIKAESKLEKLDGELTFVKDDLIKKQEALAQAEIHYKDVKAKNAEEFSLAKEALENAKDKTTKGLAADALAETTSRNEKSLQAANTAVVKARQEAEMAFEILNVTKELQGARKEVVGALGEVKAKTEEYAKNLEAERTSKIEWEHAQLKRAEAEKPLNGHTNAKVKRNAKLDLDEAIKTESCKRAEYNERCKATSESEVELENAKSTALETLDAMAEKKAKLKELLVRNQLIIGQGLARNTMSDNAATQAEGNPTERAALEENIQKKLKDIKELRATSARQERNYTNKMTWGAALTSMSSALNTLLSSIVRLKEFSDRQAEVLHQSESVLNKSVSETASQVVSEDTALVAKMLEALQQMVESRNATIGAMARV